MPTIEQVLTRADAHVLQEILGTPVVKLLVALGPDHANLDSLRRILSALYSPEAMVFLPDIRRQLVDLLRPMEANTLVAELGQATTDPYASLRGVTLRGGSSAAAIWLRFFNIALSAPAPRPDVASVQSIVVRYALFPHQRRAVKSAQAYLSEHPFRAMLHMPTGSGKTRMAMTLIADHLRAHEPGLVVWLANSEELCAQAAEEFGAAWAMLGNRAVNIYRYWGDHGGELNSAAEGVLIGGFAKIYRRAVDSPPWLATLGERVSLIVVDEAHQAIAPTYQLVLNALLARNERCGLLGLTATPGRSWTDIDSDRQLADFFDRHIVTLEVPGYSSPVDYLIDEGFLARPRYRTIQRLGPELLAQERNRLAQAFDVPESVLTRLADDEIRNLRIIDEIVRLAKSHKRILVFAATVFHAELLAVVLRAKQLQAKAVTGKTPSDDRAKTIEWYKAQTDEVRIITNFGVLTTGFDAPKTSAALIARPTTSLVLYSQMVGRATRGPLAGGNSNAEIVTVVDTGLPGFGDMAEAFVNWSDVWQK